MAWGTRGAGTRCEAGGGGFEHTWLAHLKLPMPFPAVLMGSGVGRRVDRDLLPTLSCVPCVCVVFRELYCRSCDRSRVGTGVAGLAPAPGVRGNDSARTSGVAKTADADDGSASSRMMSPSCTRRVGRCRGASVRCGEAAAAPLAPLLPGPCSMAPGVLRRPDTRLGSRFVGV